MLINFYIALQNYTSTGDRYTRSNPADVYKTYRTQQQTHYYYYAPKSG